MPEECPSGTSRVLGPILGHVVLAGPSLREDTLRLRVLLAEDNPVNQRLMVRILERRGHAVVTVETGTAAISALEREIFDLVLMDVQMPEMDGLDATTAVRQREHRIARGSRRPRPTRRSPHGIASVSRSSP